MHVNVSEINSRDLRMGVSDRVCGSLTELMWLSFTRVGYTKWTWTCCQILLRSTRLNEDRGLVIDDMEPIGDICSHSSLEHVDLGSSEHGIYMRAASIVPLDQLGGTSQEDLVNYH